MRVLELNQRARVGRSAIALWRHGHSMLDHYRYGGDDLADRVFSNRSLGAPVGLGISSVYRSWA